MVCLAEAIIVAHRTRLPTPKHDEIGPETGPAGIGTFTGTPHLLPTTARQMPGHPSPETYRKYRPSSTGNRPGAAAAARSAPSRQAWRLAGISGRQETTIKLSTMPRSRGGYGHVAPCLGNRSSVGRPGQSRHLSPPVRPQIGCRLPRAGSACRLRPTEMRPSSALIRWRCGLCFRRTQWRVGARF